MFRLILTVMFLSLATSSPALADDGHDVFCLSVQQRPATAEAARILNPLLKTGPGGDQLIKDGKVLTLEEWRKIDKDAFDRACEARVAATTITVQGTTGESIPTWLVTIGSLLIGGLVALATAEVPRYFDRRRTVARELGSAIQAFCAEAALYLDARAARSPSVATAGLEARRAELVWQLGRVQRMRRRWTWPAELRRRLVDGPLGDPLLAGWKIPAEAAALRRQVEERRVQDLAERGRVLVQALEQPKGQRSAMKLAAVSDEPVAAQEGTPNDAGA